jgi:hypothetical protein
MYVVVELTVPEPITSVVGQGEPPVTFDTIIPLGAVDEV